MAQDYRPLQNSDLLADSVDYLNDTAEALKTHFRGSVEPEAADLSAGMFWEDTLNNFLKLRNANNDGWIILGILNAAYLGTLPLTGGIMSGNLDMGGFNVTNLGEGSGAAAATVDDLELKADIEGPTFTAEPKYAANPTIDNGLTRRKYVTDTFLQLTGGTLTGVLSLTAGTSAGHALRKDQIEALVTFDAASGHNHDGTNSRKLQGTDLRATGVTLEGSPLIANGSGSAVWGTMGDTLTSQVNILSSQGPTGGYAAFDCGPHLPDAARWAILYAQIGNNCSLLLRTSSAYAGRAYRADGIGGGIWIQIFQMLIPVDDPTNPQEFDWQVTRTAGSNTVSLWLDGWL